MIAGDHSCPILACMDDSDGRFDATKVVMPAVVTVVTVG